MGLFDFFKRDRDESKPDSNAEGPSADYVFAHYALRQFALSEPLKFLYVMSTPDTKQFLSAAIEDVTQAVGQAPSFSAADIEVHRTRVRDFPCVVLQFPEPKEMADAVMVALVLPVSQNEMEKAELGEEIQPIGRYFTLEKGMSLSGENRTVFAEWNESQHSNLGEGPKPTVQAFVNAMAERLI